MQRMQWMQWTQWGMEVSSEAQRRNWRNRRSVVTVLKSCQRRSVSCTEIFHTITPSERTANKNLAKKERNQSLLHRMPCQRKQLRKIAPNTWAQAWKPCMNQWFHNVFYMIDIYIYMVLYGSLVFEHRFKRSRHQKQKAKSSKAPQRHREPSSADHQLPNYANWNLNSIINGAADPHTFTKKHGSAVKRQDSSFFPDDFNFAR